jgi:glycerate-2-kinase
MIIEHSAHLGTTPQRKQALNILEAGLKAVSPVVLVKNYVEYDYRQKKLHVRGKVFSLKKSARVFLLGAGVGSSALTTEVYREMRPVIHKAAAIDIVPSSDARVQSFVGTRLATVTNLAATQKLLGLLKDLTEDDVVIWVLTGGGNSLLGWPASGSADQQRILVSALEEAGAKFSEIQTVRKHISKIKGGHLAKLCFPATVISLIVCDDPGNDLNLVAGGVTTPDKTTIDDARHILEHYKILEHTSLMNIELFETPKEAKFFKNVHNLMLGSSRDAGKAMADKAHDLGFRLSRAALKPGEPVKPGMCSLSVGPAPLGLTTAAAWLRAGGPTESVVVLAEGSGQEGFLIDPDIRSTADRLVKNSSAHPDQAAELLREAGAQIKLHSVIPSVGTLTVVI